MRYVCPKGFATQNVWAALCKFAGTDTAYSLGPTDCYRWNRFVMAASRKKIPIDVAQLVDILITQFHFPYNVAWQFRRRHDPNTFQPRLLCNSLNVETTVVSDATALPTNDLSLAGRQIVTREWWNKAPKHFDLFVSPVVRREAMKGDPSAAARRMEALGDIPSVELTNEAVSLAEKLVEGKAVPREYGEDAMHIAVAAVSGMDYLVSWNFKHITNAQMIPKIKRVCADNGYRCAEICTPQMLQEGGAE